MIGKYRISNVQCKVKQLEIYCAVNLDPAERLANLKVKNALKCLKKILSKTSRNTIQETSELTKTIHCSLILIQAYVANIKMSENFFEKQFKNQSFTSAKQLFSELMSMLIPEKIEIVIATIMHFLRNEQQWKIECICCEIFHSLLSCRASPEILLNNMLDYIEEMITIENIEEARHVVRVMHSIISDEYFAILPDSGVIRMLSLYHLSVSMEENKFHLLRIGFKIVLIKLLHAVNVSEIVKLFPIFLEFTFKEESREEFERKDFGLTLIDGIARLRIYRIADNLQTNYLKFLLEMMTSSCEVKSFLAARILATIIDRPNNIDRFSSLMVFHVYTSYNIKIETEFDGSAKNMFVVHRELFETSIICFIKTHSMKRDNLSIIYSLLCIIVASVPCDFVVTVVVCILMNLQEYLITESQNMNKVQINHLHSLKVSVMTFICWVFRPKTLTRYVEGIVNLRYDVAPHLNPPINLYYQNDEHYNQELFFNSWKLRYCLWKWFKLDEEFLPKTIEPLEHQPEAENKKMKRIFNLLRKKTNDKVYRLNVTSVHPRIKQK